LRRRACARIFFLGLLGLCGLCFCLHLVSLALLFALAVPPPPSHNVGAVLRLFLCGGSLFVELGLLRCGALEGLVVHQRRL
jgi:hypothetical protein